jgi:hypothetical protein
MRWFPKKRRKANSFKRRRPSIERLEERQMMAVYTVDSLLDNTTADAFTTLRESVNAANTNPGSTIQFAASLTQSGPAIIKLESGELQLNDDVTINGPGAALLSIDAQGDSRVVRVGTQADVTIRGLTITGGGNVDHAAGIYGDTDANLTLARQVDARKHIKVTTRRELAPRKLALAVVSIICGSTKKSESEVATAT